jgi:hypothetical protein
LIFQALQFTSDSDIPLAALSAELAAIASLRTKTLVHNCRQVLDAALAARMIFSAFSIENL